MILQTIDPNLCIHHAVDSQKVSRYQQLMDQGVQFPAVEVLWHQGRYYVRDGAHRVSAARNLGIPVFAEVFEIDDYPNLWLLGRRRFWKR